MHKNIFAKRMKYLALLGILRLEILRGSRLTIMWFASTPNFLATHFSPVDAIVKLMLLDG